jgi:hypothetical protein
MNHPVWFAISAFVAAGIACSVFVGGPAYPGTPVPVSTEAARSLETAITQAMDSAAQTGTLELKITETEITSYLDDRLAAQADPAIANPQVILRDGKMQILGQAHSGVFVANVGVTAQFSVDNEGQPQIAITQVTYGPIAAPEAFTQALDGFLHETLMGAWGPAATGFRLQSITIADGTMTLTGRTK